MNEAVSHEIYEVYAVRYGTMQKRQRYDNFIVADPHEGAMPLDYFVWVITNSARTIVVDTGFDYEEAAQRGREIVRLPREGLAVLGVDASQVQDVIVTHLHYDHAGTLGDFPQAGFHLQELEMQYVTGRNMCHAPMRHAYSAAHVKQMVDRLFDGKLVFHYGDEPIAAGISVHYIGGHTMGLQCVRVNTQRGWLVLASDASHFYENMESVSPFPIVYNLGDMLDGYGKMRRLAQSEHHIIPGHDPLVMARYPAPEPHMQGVIARLDADPMSN